MDFLREHVGEVAALGTATCWVFSSVVFAGASRRIGPTAVNVTRMFIALAIVLAIHRIVFKTWFPSVDSTGLAYLAVSGLIGFAIGDQFFFGALIDIGPRLATVLMTLTPPVAALLAWPLLHEPLGASAILGMIITLAGIAWVALERPDPTAGKPHPHRWRGLFAGSMAAICQACGLIFSKVGIGHTRLPAEQFLDPWSASLVRLTFGAMSIGVLAAIRRAGRSAAVEIELSHLPENQAKNATDGLSGRWKNQWPMALVLLSIGAILGPVVGVWFSLVAIDHAKAAVASTLMAMTPVLILPVACWVERERISWRAAIGAVIAVVGVAILTGLGDSLLDYLRSPSQ